MELEQELSAKSIEELSALHAKLDEEIAAIRGRQNLVHAIQTEKEHARERARAGDQSLAQKVG